MEGCTSVVDCHSHLYRPLISPLHMPRKFLLKFQLRGSRLNTRTLCSISNADVGLVSGSATLPKPPVQADAESSFTDGMLPKIDRSGKFCNPRAARELALLTVYAACLDGSDPVRLLDKRLNSPGELDYEFDYTSLQRYNLMNFGGPPITTNTHEEADQLLRDFDAESANECEVLSAPPALVYSKLLLWFTKKLLVAVTDKWNDHVFVIDKVVPLNCKNEPAGRILEFAILHLAMSEISIIGTRHQIVINEAVDVAKRFCDGSAPRIVNGCLRTFVKSVEVEVPRTTPYIRAAQKIST